MKAAQVPEDRGISTTIELHFVLSSCFSGFDTKDCQTALVQGFGLSPQHLKPVAAVTAGSHRAQIPKTLCFFQALAYAQGTRHASGRMLLVCFSTALGLGQV